MAFDSIDPGKTGFVFFDIRNAHSRGSSEANQQTVSGNAWTGEVIDELGLTDVGYTIRKHRRSASYQTRLELSLRTCGPRSVHVRPTIFGTLELYG